MPVEVPLTRGLVCMVDDADAERAMRHKWYALPTKYSFYACRRGQGTAQERMHRWLLGAPDGTPVDHKDSNGLNNQRSNIRLCTRLENGANRRFVSNASGYKGVYPTPGTFGRFYATVTRDHKPVYLGSFAAAKDAARAYDAAALELFGEFASLNFPDLRSVA